MFRYFYTNIFLLISGIFFGQGINTQKLDQYFNTLEKNKKLMGTFAISDGQKIIYAKAIGLADIQPEIQSTIETQYRIGSISKIFTSVLVMKAVEEKKLKLDDKLSKYFPQIDNADIMTIEQLLKHRSGIHNITDDVDFFAYFDKPTTQETLIESIKNGGSDFKPNSQYRYSNSNYIILAFILEKIFKKSYSDLINEKIVQPLGLKNTKVMENIDAGKGMANSFTYVMGKYNKSKQTDSSVAIGGGNIMSTASDLLTFIHALENGKLVSKESLKKMQSYQDDYGYGLTTIPFKKFVGYGHDGSIDSFRSMLFYFPEPKIGISFITNQSSINNNDIGITMLKAATGEDFIIPTFDVVKLNEEELKPLVGTYSTSDFPLKIEIFIKNGQLMGQATGQGTFPLSATSKTHFIFDQAGISMDFNPSKKEMKFSQLGNEFLFTKE